MSTSPKALSQLAKYPPRFVTAASLFDGHDAAINVIRRLLQDHGAEVIHLGHNRSVEEVLRSALQEDADAIAISSYQGGHIEYFKYLIDLLKENQAERIQVFGGGGGVILPSERTELENYGVAKIFLPEDGMKLGLAGMAELMIQQALSSRPPLDPPSIRIDTGAWGRFVTAIEQEPESLGALKATAPSVVLGVTGTGGAGKSSLVDELVLRFLNEFESLRIAIYSVDPTKKKTGGALLGDRIRMNSIYSDRVYMRSIASRKSGNELSHSIEKIVAASRARGFNLIIVETSGIGQAASAITEVSDLSVYVMTSEFGAPTQLEKIDMIDFADFISINKYDRRGSEDALKAVTKQYCRARKLFDPEQKKDLPIVGTRCNLFNDAGVTILYRKIRDRILKDCPKLEPPKREFPLLTEVSSEIVPAARTFYLSEIAKVVREYHEGLRQNVSSAHDAYCLSSAARLLGRDELQAEADKVFGRLSAEAQAQIKSWPSRFEEYQKEAVTYVVRGKEVKAQQKLKSLSGLELQRVALPRLSDWGEILRFLGEENLPGYFPFTAGIYPFKRRAEEPRRQFAGEGPPEKTNKRFHYLCRHDEAKRLSTAFDSVTLYGEDPDLRPDIYGKVGESGVSIATIEDMEILYRGFDLCDPKTSVSMTINGPAPIILAMFLNVAIRQQLEKAKKDLGRALTAKEEAKISAESLCQVRGTVQADILKEDQAQNTCIFSTEFALKMMGDIQLYFIENEIRNYYSVSISGYHIAEAGANPITQLAFTLANGFTFVEYYLARGMKIDEFAPNLSFFFSNGLDPEYSVIGRVARRIWAVAMRDLYGGNERSQKLKYHIQTSGRSLHASEIEFNDIRTSLQALTAIYDNCNSLHTNAYDEAITTPTEESVRRAMAIQMIIEKEFGPTSVGENFLQGSFVMAELTRLVEEAVLLEFDRISDRGGVLGAMETQYQRSKIQEESLLYEELKHSGKLPIIGVNTFLSEHSNGNLDQIPLSRSSDEDRKKRLADLKEFQQSRKKAAETALLKLKGVATKGENVFAELMETVKVASLGQISNALYEVGGKYRRNM
ncbi:MAG: methylmalonyl-CoA mutase [Bradymonadales bacterium]|nr:MAG: methylmalonyl-CoA mutase [Bradymonadales bacterium]